MTEAERPPSLNADGTFTLNTGARIPAVGLGTWLANEGESRAAVAAALKTGYRCLDCAHLYGTEAEVGGALKEALENGTVKREDVFVTSKLWCTTSAKHRAAQALDRSLKSLQLEYLDLFLLHWPTQSPAHLGDATDPPRPLERRSSHQLKAHVKAAWQTMETLLASGSETSPGRVKAIGVSNFSQPQLEELLSYATVMPAVNQVELHPLWRQESLLQYCQSKGIHVSAHTPLGIPARYALDIVSAEHEALLNSWSKAVPAGKGKSKSVLAPMLRHTVVQQLAAKYSKTPAQILLRWGVQRGTSVMPTSVRPEHIQSNFDLLSWSLSEDDWEQLNSFEPQIALIDGKHSYLSEQGASFNSLLEEEEEAIPEEASVE